jgi:formylglycine-generating enzyme required for sulfatase activity
MNRSLAAAACVALVAGTIAAAAQSPMPPPRMVRVEGGTFIMGRDNGPSDERPAHPVTVRSFWIDSHAVTNAEFASFLQKLGGTSNARGQHLFDWDDGDARIHRRQGQWRADPGFENHPANEMTWYGARDYCAALGKRLPTEAEREYAARGREGRTYPWGEAPPSPARGRFGAGWIETVPVGSLPAGATPEGVHDLAGNVHEWTSTIMRPYPYRADDGREQPDILADRVVRGGAADTGPETLRSSWRGASVSRAARAGHHNIGFRCVRDAE